MSAQDRTLEQYHQWMKLNATAHLIRTAREVGLFEELRGGQRTLEQLCESRSLERQSTALLLDSLVAIGIVEQYQEDYALSRAAHLLCQYDDDLGDALWNQLACRLRGDKAARSDQPHFDHLAATQWIHTPAAMQAAEILDIGGQDEPSGIHILDLGCGSAVWSCAMAHRDGQACVTAVDHPAALAAAKSTAESIGMLDRFTMIEGAPEQAELPDGTFDLVLIAQRLHCLGDQPADALLDRAIRAAKPGGRIAVIDLFRGPTDPDLTEAIEAIRFDLETTGGRMRSLEETQNRLAAQGLEEIQFSFLVASKLNLGMAVGNKPSR